jgi:3' terminal RNA ribose 2'-O-methyltransferase Hen1
MLLEISTTFPPATDLGFLLEKHPARVHEYDLAGGKATVFYREANEARCTVALLLDIDPIGLSRGKGAGGESPLQPYVNDRPYVASSFLSVALGTAFRSALAGKCRHKPELAATPMPLEAALPVLPCRGGEDLLRSLFEPLGYSVEAGRLPLDPTMPDWGPSSYYSVRLRADKTVRELLQHLYVLIPVLDDEKHYWVGDAEVEKLVRHAGEWLGSHPKRDVIARRYFKHRRSLARDALARLVVEDDDPADDSPEDGAPRAAASREQALEQKISLNQRRIERVTQLVQQLGGTSLVDLGCGEAKVLASLFKLKTLTRLVGMDVSMRSLEIAAERLNLDRLPPLQRKRIELLHGSLIYRDQRLSGFDVATVIEVVEHLDAARLAAFERVLFEFTRPSAIVLTTPNREYNVRFSSLPAGQLRHADHRFEWTRAEFQDWARRQARRFGYDVEFEDIGDVDELLGAPTQVGVFSRGAAGPAAAES